MTILQPPRLLRPPLVLAYHGLGPHQARLDPHNLMVDPLQFRAQMRRLRGRGYRFVSLRDYVDGLVEGEEMDGACALTFDDGTVDNLHTLAPILVELGLPATIFACPGLLGAPHFAMPAEAGVRLMNAEELRELDRVALVEVGSHTSLHVDMSSMSSEEAYREMASSKQALEDLLQKPVDTFAYPKCGFSPSCPEAARRAGYKVAVTCGARGGDDPFALARESIDPLDRRVSFALKSRRLFIPLRESVLGKLARAIASPARHRGSRGSAS